VSQYIITIKFDEGDQIEAENICAGIADYCYEFDSQDDKPFHVSMAVVVPAATRTIFADAPGRGELTLQRQSLLEEDR
jgi:hypothetical protein